MFVYEMKIVGLKENRHRRIKQINKKTKLQFILRSSMPLLLNLPSVS